MTHSYGIDTCPKAFEGYVRRATQSHLARLTVAALLWAFSSASMLLAQAPPADYEVKASYLYQFGKFVEWPDSALARAGGDFAICTFGADPFGIGRALEETSPGRTVQDKKVVTKRLSKLDDVSDCNILFIGSSEQNHLADISKLAQGRNILTVGESGKFLQQGGMIEFQIDQNKVRFEINLSAVERANLKVSSQLLKVAKVTKN